MLLLINYHRRLAKSKQTETYFAMIVNAASQEMDFIVKAENLSNDVAGPLARKACLLLSSCLCFFELMKENELLWNMEDSISKSIVNSLLTISKNCFDNDIPRIFGKEMSFTLEILGLEILFEILTYKKLRKSDIPAQIVQRMQTRLNEIKSFDDEVGQGTAMNIIFLNLMMLIMLQCRSICSLFNVLSFSELANKMVRAEEYAPYQKVLINLMAIMLDERNTLVDDKMKVAIKEKFNILYMDILAVNTSTIVEDLWVGMQHNPLELSNFMEHWMEGVLRDQQVVFPIFPRFAVQLKI